MSETTDCWMDRTGWGSGPWDGEPDRVEWRYRDLPCLIVRGPGGALCGYVGVPPGHPWHGVDWEVLPVQVHGGLSYANTCDEGGKICHVPLEGEPDNVWWLGFDCGHMGDLAPRDLALSSFARELARTCGVTYRNLAYVRCEVERLADQVAAR